MIGTVTISRSSLSLAPLVITGDASGVYSLTAAGLGRPAITARTATAAESPWLAGSLVVAAVREPTTLPLEILVQASTAAGPDVAIDELDAALWQYDYAVTVDVGGVAKVWRASPASWGVSGDGMLHARAARFLEVVSVVIPVHPIPETA